MSAPPPAAPTSAEAPPPSGPLAGFVKFLPLLVAFPVVMGLVLVFVLRDLKQTSAPPPPILAQLPDFSLTDHLGRPCRSSDLRGKVWIADFVFTRCASACPRLTSAMARIQERIRSEGEPIQLVSISIDPDHDRPEVLAEYARAFRADPKIWRFVTGPADEVKNAVVAGFKLPIGDPVTDAKRKAADAFEILHSEKFVLVDRAGQIRGYYDSDSAGFERIQTDAARLASPEER